MNKQRVVWMAAGLMAAGTAALANEAPASAGRAVQVDVQAQPMIDALNQLATQAGLRIVFYTEITSGVTAPRLVGSYTPEQALKKLLEASDLEYTFTNARTVEIRSAGASPGIRPTAWLPTGHSIQLAQANDSQNEREQITEVIVQGVRFHDQEAGTALKVPMAIKDIPQTVIAITGDVMDVAAIKEFQDVYKVDPTGGSIHRTDNWTINFFRGFRQQSDNALKIDGFRLRSGISVDLAAFERLELVKGATSTMYGQNSVAGTLNAISKMPKSEFGGEFKAEVGSFDHHRFDADVYGPINDDGTLAYRAVAARLDEESFMDYASKKTTVFSPTLRYQIGTDTSVYARLNYQEADVVPQWGAGLQYLGDILDGFANGFDPDLLVIPRLPRSHFNGASWNKSHFESTLIHAGLEHRFDNGWKLRANLQHNEQNFIVHQEMAGNFQADGVPLSAFNERNDNRFTLDGGEINLFGDVEAFGRAHTVFLGVDYSSIDNPLLYSSADVSSPSVFDPTFNTAVAPTASLADYTFYFDRQLRQKSLGVTAQVFIRPVDRLTLLLGGRYSMDENGDNTRSVSALADLQTAAFNVVDLDTDVFTLQSGITYALTPELNLYASYGETFEPQTGLTAPSTFADPEEGVAKEIGLKGVRSNRFSYSLALFEMTRNNITQGRPGTLFVDPIGTQRSRGVEVEFQGTVLPGWEVFAALGRMEAEFTDGEYRGYRPPEAPKFGASLFTSYEVQGGALRGYGIGGGVVHRSGRETFFTALGTNGLPLVYDFGDYTEVDLRVYRNAENWRVQLSVTNLFNEKYYAAPPYNGFAFGVHVNPARTVMGQLVYRF